MNINLIYPVWFRWNLKKTRFKLEEIECKGYLDEPVCFPLNHIIKELVKPEDSVKVILIQTNSDTRITDKNVELAKEEINSILSGCCKNLEFTIVKTPYASKQRELGNIYMDIRNEITPKSIVMADLTYGVKYMPLILFCVLNYAEKYLECNIEQIVYGLFDNEASEDAKMVDFTKLYLLNTFGALFDGKKETFDNFTMNLLQ